MLLFVACSADLSTAIVSGDGFFDHPWPSDTRLNADGTADMAGYLAGRAGGDDLYTLYEDEGSKLEGFSTNPTVFFRFTGALDTDLLAEDDDAVLLVNVDAYSQNRGDTIPITWDFQAEETAFQPSNLLAIQPVWGAALEPHTTYAALVTNTLAAAAEGWSIEDQEALSEVLPFLGVDPDDVAIATSFTTHDPTAEVAQIAQHIRSHLTVPPLDQALIQWETGLNYNAYEGSILVPNWQHGDKPYAFAGGGFRVDGTPQLAAWEQTRFTLTVPIGEAPMEGWPVALYAHGTGGDQQTFADQPNNAMEPAAVLASQGIAGFGIAQPLHGDRWTGDDPTFYVFNYVNPESGVTSFRQGALDLVYLAEVLTRYQHNFELPEGNASTNPSQVLFLGHSHGGMTGAMAAPFISDRVGAMVLSGAGGGTTNAVLLRDENDLDIDGLLASLLDFDENETLDMHHPVTALIQFFSDRADPINYAPYWHRLGPWWTGRSQHILVTEGLEDTYTPPLATESLALAAGVPVLTEDSTSANLDGWDGQPVTSALVQFPDDGHFAIFRNEQARDTYATFLSTALQGAPRIERSP